MRYQCKVWPLDKPHPAFPAGYLNWQPLINVRLIHQHSPPTKTIECLIDSGSPSCVFNAGLCHSLGIKRLEDGPKDYMSGLFGGPKSPVYFHKVKVLIASEQFETVAAFSQDLPIAGILGRLGFFQNFIVKFDCTGTPPTVELEKVHHA